MIGLLSAGVLFALELVLVSLLSACVWGAWRVTWRVCCWSWALRW